MKPARQNPGSTPSCRHRNRIVAVAVKLALLSGGIGLPMVVTAEEADTPKDLSTVTVTATRANSIVGQTPEKVTIITRDQIEQQLRVTTDRSQILATLIPGYTPGRQKLTNSGETFRGREALIMIDGVPQSNPLRDSARDGYTIDLAMVERIEVIHGASAEHGLGATGGIINYVTRGAAGTEADQQVSVAVESDDDFNSDGLGSKIAYHAVGQNNDLEYLAGLSYQEHGVFYDGDGRRVGIDEISGEIQDTDSYDLFGKLAYWLDPDQSLSLSVNHFDLESNADYVAVPGDRTRGIPTSSQAGTPPNDPTFNEQTMVNLAYDNSDWLASRLSSQFYYQEFRAQFGTHPFAFPYTDSSGNARLDQTRTESDKLGGKFSVSRDGLLDGRLKLTTGLDMIQDQTRQVLVQTGRTYVPESELFNVAGFIQADASISNALSLHGGMRYEYAEISVDDFNTIDRSNVTQDLVSVDGGNPSFTEPLFNAGVVYRFTDSLQVFGNYSEGFGIPDVGRVFRGISQPGQDVDTLVELEPIVTDNREVGLRLNSGGYGLELSYYESDSDLGERLEQQGTTFVGQREKVEIRGVDLNGHYQISDSHRASFIYAYNEGESDTDGDGIVDTDLTGFNVAPARLSVMWDGQWTPSLSTHVNATHYFSDTFSDQSNPNLRAFHGYDLVNVSMGYQLSAGELSVGIGNLFDEQYISYYSQTARDGANQYFAGRGRTYRIGYRLPF